MLSKPCCNLWSYFQCLFSSLLHWTRYVYVIAKCKQSSVSSRESSRSGRLAVDGWRVIMAIRFLWTSHNGMVSMMATSMGSKRYRQVSNIRRTKSQHLKYSRTVLRLSLPNFLEASCQVENEDVVGAAPTGDAPTTSEWSTILLPTKVRLILEVLRYLWDADSMGSKPRSHSWGNSFIIVDTITRAVATCFYGSVVGSLGEVIIIGFYHNCHLLCCLCTITCSHISHISSIQNNTLWAWH